MSHVKAKSGLREGFEESLKLKRSTAVSLPTIHVLQKQPSSEWAISSDVRKGVGMHNDRIHPTRKGDKLLDEIVL